MIEINDEQGLADFFKEDWAVIYFEASWSEYAGLSKQIIQFVENRLLTQNRGIKVFFGQFGGDRVSLAASLVAAGVPQDSFSEGGTLSIFQRGRHLFSMKSVDADGQMRLWKAIEPLLGSSKT